MAYTKTTWQDLPNTTTPVNATNLNKIENGIEAIDNDVSTINNNIGDLTDLETSDTSSLVSAVNSLRPIVLFEGASTNTTINLSDNVNNYTFIIITLFASGEYFTVYCLAPFNKKENATIWNGGSYLRGAEFILNGTTLTFNWKKYGNFSDTGTENITVYKVVGYK